jgi:quercetin dioxygenase-like cupin family protein
MKSLKWLPIFILALVVIVVSGVLAKQAIHAQSKGGLFKDVKTTDLFREDLADMPGKEAIIQELEYPPGWSSGKHQHPGDTYFYVLSGSVKIEQEGKAPVTVNPGQVFYESPKGVYNAIPENGTRTLFIRIYDKGKPLSIPVK